MLAALWHNITEFVALIWPDAAGLAALAALDAFFAAAETALRSARKGRLTQWAEDGRRGAARALRLLEQPARVMTGIQVAITAIYVAAATTSSLIALKLAALQLPAGAPMASLITGPLHARLLYALAAAGVALTLILLLFGEILPKTLASQKAEEVAVFVAPLIDEITGVTFSIASAFTWISNRVVKATGLRDPHRGAYIAEEEIKMMAVAGAKAGELQPEETEMIHSVIELGDTVAREVMVPRIDITAVDVSAGLDEVLDAILEDGHSRIPVYKDSIDNIIGIIHARDVLEFLRDAPPPALDLSRFNLRKPLYVPENKRASELLKNLRASKTAMAIVIDEYGGTAGLVTIEDVVEEIVGEILDEWDVEEQPIRQMEDNTVLFDARVRIEDVNDYLSIDLPDEESVTLGGLLFDRFGTLPEAGQSLEAEGVRFAIEKTDGHRILEVRAQKLSGQPGAELPAAEG